MFMKRSLGRLALLAAVMLGAAGPAQAQTILQLDKPAYFVSSGTTVSGTMTFQGNSVDIGSPIYLTTYNSGIATVTPGVVYVQQHPSGYGYVQTPFTITGITGGGTTLDATAYLPNNFQMTATSSITVIDCPASATLQGTPEEDSALSSLYRFRDKVMKRTALGRAYVDMFYEHAVEGSLLLFKHPELREQSYAVLSSLMPAIRAAAAGKTGTITKSQLRDILGLLDDIEALGGQDIDDAVAQLRSELRPLLKAVNIRVK